MEGSQGGPQHIDPGSQPALQHLGEGAGPGGAEPLYGRVGGPGSRGLAQGRQDHVEGPGQHSAAGAQDHPVMATHWVLPTGLGLETTPGSDVVSFRRSRFAVVPELVSVPVGGALPVGPHVGREARANPGGHGLTT